MCTYVPGRTLTQSSRACCRGDSFTSSFSLTVSDCDGGVGCCAGVGTGGTGIASAPPLPLLAVPSVLNLLKARAKGKEDDTLAPDAAARELVDLVILGVTPLMGGGSFADAALFRAPAEEPLQACFREAELEEEEEEGVAADAKGVVGREVEPRELVLGPAASLASLLTPR